MSGTHAKHTSAWRRTRFVVGVVVVTALVWGFSSIPYDILREERARLYGEELTTGQVVEVDTVPEGAADGARIVITYRYVDPDGFARSAEARMPGHLWQRHRPGDVIKVIFVRTRPDVVRIPDEIEPAFQLWLRDVMD